MNKKIMKAAGLEEEAKLAEIGVCPVCKNKVINGASEGNDYKKRQGLVSRFATFHLDGIHPPGSTFTMLDGKKYKVASDGSYRRIKVLRRSIV